MTQDNEHYKNRGQYGMDSLLYTTVHLVYHIPDLQPVTTKKYFPLESMPEVGHSITDPVFGSAKVFGRVFVYKSRFTLVEWEGDEDDQPVVDAEAIFKNPNWSEQKPVYNEIVVRGTNRGLAAWAPLQKWIHRLYIPFLGRMIYF